MPTPPLPRDAVQLGLIEISENGEQFPKRNNKTACYLIDVQGAGCKVPLRRIIVQGLTGLVSIFPDVDIIAGVAISGTM